MKRFLSLKSGDKFILASETDNQLAEDMKSAAYYLHEITKDLNDSEFEQWLVDRKITGFDGDDITQLQNSYNHPIFKYFLNIMNFPLYCSSIIQSCIDLNDLRKSKQSIGEYTKWL